MSNKKKSIQLENQILLLIMIAVIQDFITR